MQRSMLPKEQGVYLIHDKDASGSQRPLYVGSTVNLARRIPDHLGLLKNGDHHNYRLQAAHDAGHQLEVTAIPLPGVDVLAVEQEMLDRYLPSGKLMNIATDAASPMKGRSITEETREKLRARPKQEWSEERRQKLSASLTGITRSEETRAKLSAAKTGVPTGRAGIPRSDEVKQKLSEARSIPVTYDGVTYPSTKVAAETLGLSYTTMARRISGNR